MNILFAGMMLKDVSLTKRVPSVSEACKAARKTLTVAAVFGVILGFSAAPVNAQIVVVSHAESREATTQSDATHTISDFTVADGSNRKLVLCASWESGATSISATWKGTESFTVAVNSAGGRNSAILYLDDPTPGTGAIVVTLGAATGSGVGVMSLTGAANGVASVSSAAGLSGSLTTTEADTLVVGVYTSNGDYFGTYATPFLNGLYTGSTKSSHGAAGYQNETTAGLKTYDWEDTNADADNNVLAAFVPPDTTAPTLTPGTIVDDKSGGPVDINTLVTYTVTFSEDMDASTVAADDFGNAGSAAITIGTVAETGPNTGVFTVPVTATGGGTLQLRVNADAELTDVAGNALDTASAIVDDTTITVNAVDGTAPTLADDDIVDDQGGASVPVDTLVTYTVTFSEDMDASTVGADDFGNAGGAAVTIGTVAETGPNTGVFTVPVTATGGGTLQLRVNADAELTDVAGNPLDTSSAIADDTTISVDVSAPTLAAADIVDDQGGASVPADTLVTYTVAFSEAMDASTVGADDFGNAGSAIVSMGTVTETTPNSGVFSAQVTPTRAGTLQLQVNAGAELKDAVGNVLDTASAIADDTTLTVTASVSASITVVNTDSFWSSSNLGSYTKSFNAGEADKLILSPHNEGSWVSTITYNGMPLTQIPGSYAGFRANGVWYLDNPYTGGAADIVVTMGGTGAQMGLGIVSIAGSADGYKDVATGAQSVELDVSTADSFVYVGFGVNQASSVTASGPLTQIAISGSDSMAADAGYQNGVAAGPHTYSCTAIGSPLTYYSTAAAFGVPDTIAPMLVAGDFADDKSGGPIDVNTLVTYTVTFSEDMDASTVGADDFGNAGGAAVTIGTVSETGPNTGVFTVPVTATGAGTLQLQVNAGAVLRDVAGNALITTSAIVDDTTITVVVTAPTLAPGTIFSFR